MIKKMLIWFAKNLLLFIILYAISYATFTLLNLRTNIYQAILFWIAVKVIMMPFVFEKKGRK